MRWRENRQYCAGDSAPTRPHSVTTMIADALILLLLAVIAILLYRISTRLERGLALLAGVKLHVREMKEEHWTQLYSIHCILQAMAEADERISKTKLKFLQDTPSPTDGTGRWWYHMPAGYFEVDWAGENTDSEVVGSPRQQGRAHAAEMLKREIS